MNRAQRRSHWLNRHRINNRAKSGAVAIALKTGRNAETVHPCPGRVHVEELILHGFTTNSGSSIGDATQTELKRMLQDVGLPLLSAHETARIDAGDFRLPNGAGPKSIGAHIAKSIYRGLKQ